MSSQLIAEINADLMAEQASSDGAIEPFEIRRVVALQTHTSEVRRGQSAFLEEGNVSDTGGVDMFVSIVRYADRTTGITPFEDESSAMGDLRISSEERSADNRLAGVYDDQNTIKGVMESDLMEDDLLAAVRAMSPSSENYVPTSHIHVGVHGFDDYVARVSPHARYS